MPRIYLDHAATTPLDPVVLEAMLPLLQNNHGNPSSVHAEGRRARFLVEECRERVAAVLGAEPAEIIFTSGGTEANNAVLEGIWPEGRPGVLTSLAEHEAVLHPARRQAARGRPVRYLRPQKGGGITPEQVAEALDEAVGLVSLMHVNNETGAITDIRAIARICRERGVVCHTDAVQSVGHLPVRVDTLGVDALSLSAHKFYGPKGVGLLYVRSGTPFTPLIEGGAQERGRRAGTENVAGIVGLATALERAQADQERELDRLERLRRRLHDGLRERLGDLFVCATPMQPGAAAPHVLNIAFPPRDGQPFDGEMLILGLDLEGIAVSSGSACTSGALAPSHVLKAIGLDDATASAAIRFSLGRNTTDEDIERTIEAVERVVSRMIA